MKALLVLPEPPIPFGGASGRWFHVLLSGLAERGVATTALICSGGSDADAKAKALHGNRAELLFFAPVKTRWWGRLASLYRPFSYPYSPQMAGELDRRLRQSWDIVRFESQFSAYLLRKPPAVAELNIHQLFSIDHVTCTSESLTDKLRMRTVLRSEKTLIRRFQRVSAITSRLADAVLAIHPTADMRVTPVTLDPAAYPFPSPPRPPGRPPTLGLIGTFRWGPTLSAARVLVDEVWPTVRERLPMARLVLAGRGAAAAFPNVGASTGIEIHNDVPDAIPYFQSLDALVYLPSVGSGTKIKILEAIALGTPVVTNDEGAEGLPDRIRAAICVNSTQAAIERSIDLLTSRTRYAPETLRDEFFAERSPQRCVDSALKSGLPTFVVERTHCDDWSR